jgi:hypothetical protein
MWIEFSHPQYDLTRSPLARLIPALDAGRSTVRTLILAYAMSYFDVLEMLGDAAWELVTASIEPTSFTLVLKRERTTG